MLVRGSALVASNKYGASLFQFQTSIVVSIISTGFPSPADDYMDVGIDLNKHLIQNPASTFFLRVAGNLMTNAGIQDGDILVVDRSIDPKPGEIVIAVINGTFTLKRLTFHNGSLYLEANYLQCQPIKLFQHNDVQIWGVAIYSIHKLKTLSQRK